MVPSNVYISVDIEASGPIPGEYSLLSIGAYIVGTNPAESFYVELQPINSNAIKGALDVSKLSMEHLAANGTAPKKALQHFASWIDSSAKGRTPVFVGFNAPFDWSFINWYFHKFLAKNPFGHAALDIKSLYKGYSGCQWQDTGMSSLPFDITGGVELSHNAKEDAEQQGRIFENIETLINKEFRQREIK